MSGIGSAFVALVFLIAFESMLYVMRGLWQTPRRALIAALAALLFLDTILHTVILGGNWIAGLAVPCEDLPPSLSYLIIVFPLTHLVPDGVLIAGYWLYPFNLLDLSHLMTLSDQATNDLFEFLPTWAKCVSSG